MSPPRGRDEGRGGGEGQQAALRCPYTEVARSKCEEGRNGGKGGNEKGELGTS